jgi:hypothetical protein
MGSSRNIDDGARAPTSLPEQENRRFGDASTIAMPRRESGKKTIKKAAFAKALAAFAADRPESRLAPEAINASRIVSGDVPCGNRPSYVRLHERHA